MALDLGTYLHPSPAVSSTEGGLEPARTAGKESVSLCTEKCGVPSVVCAVKLQQNIVLCHVLWEHAARNQHIGARIWVCVWALMRIKISVAHPKPNSYV